jgi:nucleoside phosphorylase
MPHCAVVVTALDVEYRSVRAHLTDIIEEQHPQGNIYERGYFSSGKYSWRIGIVQTRKGDVKAGIQTERAISHFRPSIVVFVGVAGGVKDVSLGDVVIADKVYAYESGKDDLTFRPRPEMGISSFRLIERAQAEARKEDWVRRIGPDATDKPPQAFIGPIAAGEKVVVSKLSAAYTFLRQYYSDSLDHMERPAHLSHNSVGCSWRNRATCEKEAGHEKG